MKTIKIIDLLNKIANGEIEYGTIFYVNGDFFYNLIIIDEELYVINTMTKQLELLGGKYIDRFIRNDVELLKLNDEVEIPEEMTESEKAVRGWNKYCKAVYDMNNPDSKEEPTTCEEFAKMFQENCKMFQPKDNKIEKIDINFDYIEFGKMLSCVLSTKFSYNEKVIINKINEIIDILNKGDK